MSVVAASRNVRGRRNEELVNDDRAVCALTNVCFFPKRFENKFDFSKEGK